MQVAVDEAGGHVATRAVHNLCSLSAVRPARAGVGVAPFKEHAHDLAGRHGNRARTHAVPVHIDDLGVDEYRVHRHAPHSRVNPALQILNRHTPSSLACCLHAAMIPRGADKLPTSSRDYRTQGAERHTVGQEGSLLSHKKGGRGFPQPPS